MGPRRSTDNAHLREQQREHIAIVASAVFARRGFAGTRIADIATEAGISHGLVHHYFDSKANLFTVLVDRVMASAVQVPAMAAAQPGSALDRLRWYVQITLLGVTKAPHMVLLVWHALRAEVVPEAARGIVQREGGRAMLGLAELIASAQAEGDVIAGDPLLLATHLNAYLQGLAALASHGPVPAGCPDADLVLRGFLTFPP